MSPIFSKFPSSKPLKTVTRKDTTVNAKLPSGSMNEMTMRSVLTLHCSGFSCREDHKFALIFDMPAHLKEKPPHYINKIEEVTKSTPEVSMQAAADVLQEEADYTPSTVPGSPLWQFIEDSRILLQLGIWIFDFWSHKEILDHDLINRICEECNRWSAKRWQEQPDE